MPWFLKKNHYNVNDKINNKKIILSKNFIYLLLKKWWQHNQMTFVTFHNCENF